jgi:Tfp pilus assembly protein PilO
VFEFLQSLARDKKKLAIAGVLLAAFLYADFTFVIGGQIKALKTIKQKIVSLRKDIEVLNKDISYVKKNTRAAATPVKVKRLVSEKEIPSLLQNISAIANENGIRIMQIDSSKEMPKASKKKETASIGKKGAKPIQQKDKAVELASVKIKLDIIAGYHKLGNFINEIENADKFCMIDGISITRNPIDPLKHKVSLVVKTYVK